MQSSEDHKLICAAFLKVLGSSASKVSSEKELWESLAVIGQMNGHDVRLWCLKFRTDETTLYQKIISQSFAQLAKNHKSNESINSDLSKLTSLNQIFDKFQGKYGDFDLSLVPGSTGNSLLRVVNSSITLLDSLKESRVLLIQLFGHSTSSLWDFKPNFVAFQPSLVDYGSFLTQAIKDICDQLETYIPNEVMVECLYLLGVILLIFEALLERATNKKKAFKYFVDEIFLLFVSLGEKLDMRQSKFSLNEDVSNAFCEIESIMENTMSQTLFHDECAAGLMRKWESKAGKEDTKDFPNESSNDFLEKLISLLVHSKQISTMRKKKVLRCVLLGSVKYVETQRTAEGPLSNKSLNFSRKRKHQQVQISAFPLWRTISRTLLNACSSPRYQETVVLLCEVTSVLSCKEIYEQMDDTDQFNYLELESFTGRFLKLFKSKSSRKSSFDESKDEVAIVGHLIAACPQLLLALSNPLLEFCFCSISEIQVPQERHPGLALLRNMVEEFSSMRLIPQFLKSFLAVSLQCFDACHIWKLFSGESYKFMFRSVFINLPHGQISEISSTLLSSLEKLFQRTSDEAAHSALPPLLTAFAEFIPITEHAVVDMHTVVISMAQVVRSYNFTFAAAATASTEYLHFAQIAHCITALLRLLERLGPWVDTNTTTVSLLHFGQGSLPDAIMRRSQESTDDDTLLSFSPGRMPEIRSLFDLATAYLTYIDHRKHEEGEDFKERFARPLAFFVLIGITQFHFLDLLQRTVDHLRLYLEEEQLEACIVSICQSTSFNAAEHDVLALLGSSPFINSPSVYAVISPLLFDTLLSALTSCETETLESLSNNLRILSALPLGTISSALKLKKCATTSLSVISMALKQAGNVSSNPLKKAGWFQLANLSARLLSRVSELSKGCIDFEMCRSLLLAVSPVYCKALQTLGDVLMIALTSLAEDVTLQPMEHDIFATVQFLADACTTAVCADSMDFQVACILSLARLMRKHDKVLGHVSFTSSFLLDCMFQLEIHDKLDSQREKSILSAMDQELLRVSQSVFGGKNVVVPLEGEGTIKMIVLLTRAFEARQNTHMSEYLFKTLVAIFLVEILSEKNKLAIRDRCQKALYTLVTHCSQSNRESFVQAVMSEMSSIDPKRRSESVAALEFLLLTSPKRLYRNWLREYRHRFFTRLCNMVISSRDVLRDQVVTEFRVLCHLISRSDLGTLMVDEVELLLGCLTQFMLISSRDLKSSPLMNEVWVVVFYAMVTIVKQSSNALSIVAPFYVSIMCLLMELIINEASGNALWCLNFDRLLELIKPFSAVFKKHLTSLLLVYIKAVGQKKLSTFKQRLLRPGIFALLDMVSLNETEQLFVVLSSNEKTIFQVIHQEFKDLHEYSGKV